MNISLLHSDVVVGLIKQAAYATSSAPSLTHTGSSNGTLLAGAGAGAAVAGGLAVVVGTRPRTRRHRA